MRRTAFRISAEGRFAGRPSRNARNTSATRIIGRNVILPCIRRTFLALMVSWALGRRSGRHCADELRIHLQGAFPTYQSPWSMSYWLRNQISVRRTAMEGLLPYETSPPEMDTG
ncbi:hypothetical protein P152DRAFT_462448 [Eremomyces bilateralis CBS 781.70]|uniref:Uncharacterized protein n=1 Tax=Eremomyces bilateralis CBS 781.70 TaxID=1392243 RepID=A0A6G1FRQ2_9PEZI|nr:uncharacterized protein P152DRAFT_462448 [Eremomyces bilateralis CBS 781.70]KAF1808457.1 hypothetical protein P152DRAFT_462448 [Eremomyces bilateralis CBS 781.70]